MFVEAFECNTMNNPKQKKKNIENMLKEVKLESLFPIHRMKIRTYKKTEQKTEIESENIRRHVT